MARSKAITKLPSLEELLKRLRAHLPELRQRYGIQSLGVFGSYVRGEQRKGSDLDVLVEFEDDFKPNLLEFIGLKHELGDTLGIKVDLVEKKGLKPYIGRRILAEVIYLSETEGEPVQRRGKGLASQRRELRDYLQDILDKITDVEQFIKGVDFETFTSDTQKVYAVLHALMIIGEAVRKIPVSLRRTHAAVPWRSIVGLHNIVAHEYFAVYLPHIWRIIHEDLSPLREATARIMDDLNRQELTQAQLG